MMKKLSLFIVFGLALALTLNFTYNSPKPRNIAHPNTTITGSETPSYQPSGKVINTPRIYGQEIFSDSVTIIVNTETGGQSIYDLQSNGVPQHIVQDQANPNIIHTVFMVNLTPGWPATDRRISYYVSTDAGLTFDYLGDVPDAASSGFPAIDLLSDGRALITSHTVAGGVAAARTQIFVEQSTGSGVFNRQDPGQVPGAQNGIWPAIIATKSIADAVKYVVISSINVASAPEMTYLNRGLTLTSPGSFSGWVVNPNANNANTYNFERSAAGKLGLVYVVNDDSSPMTLGGDVQFTESNDNGVTWSAPITVLDAVPNGDGTVYGALRGVDIVYLGETPKVVMEYIRQDPAASSYYPGLASQIKFWSPDVNGGNMTTIADSATNPNFSNPNGGSTDVYTPICRPTIGISSDNNVLFCAFEVARADTNELGTPFYDVYFTSSVNGGAAWSNPMKITNMPGQPLRDNRFVNLAPRNTGGVTAPLYQAHLVYQRDSVPGSVTQTPAAPESIARQVYAKVTSIQVIGIKSISNETPNGFTLKQNYPNPFNPTTNIRFELPQSSHVTLKIYNVSGQLVATLLDENVAAGVKEYEFNASSLPSGIYFYTMNAGTFTDTKKMILVK